MKKPKPVLSEEDAARIDRLCRDSKRGRKLDSYEMEFINKMYCHFPAAYKSISDRAVEEVIREIQRGSV